PTPRADAGDAARQRSQFRRRRRRGREVREARRRCAGAEARRRAARRRARTGEAARCREARRAAIPLTSGGRQLPYRKDTVRRHIISVARIEEALWSSSFWR